MKSKTLVWAYLLILSLGTILSLYIPKNAAVAKESVVIPGDAIRLRILANSDLDSDQALKRDVRDAVNAKITVWVKDLTSLQKAKEVIKSKLPELQTTAEQVVHEHGSNQSVKVQFGKVQFPTKLYGEFLYPAGEYQAVLITLGKGQGANWWCVLYPPLCFLDFSNGVAVSDGFEDHKAKAETVSEAKTSDQGSSVEEGSSLDQTSSDTSSNNQTSGTGEQQTAVQPSKQTSDTTSSTVDEKTDNQDHTQMSAGTLNASAAVEDPSSVDNSSTAADGPSSGGDTPSSAVGDPSTVAGKSLSEVDTPSSAAGNSSSNVDTPSSIADNSSSNVDTPTSVADNSSSGTNNQEKASKPQDKKAAPVYTSDDEQPVKVKFFIVELFQKLFE